MEIAYIGCRDFRGGRGRERFNERLGGYVRAAQKCKHRIEYVNAYDIAVRSHPVDLIYRGVRLSKLFDCAIVDNTSGGIGISAAMQTFFTLTLYLDQFLGGRSRARRLTKI